MKHLELALHKRIELALTEEQFLDWDRSQQTEWVKEHPNSRFAELLGKKPKGATLAPAAPKAKKATTLKDVKDKAKAKEAKFKEILKTKTPEDRKALIQARKDGVPVPPAWTDITYYGKNEDIRARGRDSKGRMQSVESPAYREKQTVLKHQRIQADLEPVFDAKVEELRKQAQKPGNTEHQVLYVISQMAFRIGGEGDGKAKEKAYGATNLEGRHVTVKGKEVIFDFQGKENVRQYHVTTDPVIRKIMSGKRDPNERIFKTTEEKVRDAWKVMGGKKVHDMRSIWATRIAKEELAKRKDNMPTTEKEMKKMQMEIAEIACKKLGNDASECLNTYIDRSIFPAVKGDGQ